MVVLLKDSEVDPDTEALDNIMTEAESDAATGSLHTTPMPVENLHDGKRGNRVTMGRAVARRAWMWDGTPTLLPIAWNPEGTQQDGGRAYMNKRHCLCCGVSGFRGNCLKCIKSNCVGCRAGTDRTKLIRCYYLTKEAVPFPQKFYGPIDCFQSSCVRRNGMGFQTEEDMRMHARSKHRMEYASRQETLAEAKSDETIELRKQVAHLTNLVLGQTAQASAQNMVVDPTTSTAPLYISEKPKKARRTRRAKAT
jgi:hypothetical protein